MIRKIALIALTGTTMTMANDLYTDTYFYQSGVVKWHVETGIPNRMSANKLRHMKSVYHASLYFQEGHLTQASEEKLKELLSLAKENGGNYYVSVIGHSSGYADLSHTVKLDGWAQFWHNIDKRNTTESDLANAVNYRIKKVHDYLTAHDVPLTRIYNENRMNRDPLYTEATKEGAALNRRVDVTLYR